MRWSRNSRIDVPTYSIHRMHCIWKQSVVEAYLEYHTPNLQSMGSTNAHQSYVQMLPSYVHQDVRAHTTRTRIDNESVLQTCVLPDRQLPTGFITDAYTVPDTVNFTSEGSGMNVHQMGLLGSKSTTHALCAQVLCNALRLHCTYNLVSIPLQLYSCLPRASNVTAEKPAGVTCYGITRTAYGNV